jgi:cytochrome c553
MQINRKLTVIAAMAVIVTTAVAFTAPVPPENGYKNLKILPKDISQDQLRKLMHGYNSALGVKCNFCHAASKDTSVHHPDFASDEKPEKEIARQMMKMTVKINKSFFEAKHPSILDSTLTVTCVTCHHGTPHPEGNEEEEQQGGNNSQTPPPPKQ